jgi:hypothetical protein
MKKSVIVFALSAFLVSCGGSAAEVDVKSLDSGCACAEASIAILKESKELYEMGTKEGPDMNESEQEELSKKMSNLETKYSDIMKKMMEVAKEGEECPETGVEMMILLKEMNSKRGLNFEIPAELSGF